MTWDEYFMNMCYLIASKSKDQSTHVGAVIVFPKDNSFVSSGYNSFPIGINDNDPFRQERPKKYFYFEHAERNAIYLASRKGTPLDGCKMYTNGFPCADCARGIIQAGIKEVIYDKEWDTGEERIEWTDSHIAAKEMFFEAGVVYRFMSCKLIKPIKFIRGKDVS